MTSVGGADGCRAGWLCIERSSDGTIRHELHRSTSALMSRARELAVLAIDIPIGLPDDGPRSVDLVARRLLGPRASSVFPAPARAALRGSSYLDACERSFEACGKRLSKQAFAILPKIREVDEALLAEPDLREQVREVHPELCFFQLNGESPMDHPKKTGQGFLERHELVENYFGTVFSSIRSLIARSEAQDDDILDAFVALWTAERIEKGAALSFPNTPEYDRFGLRMEMVV